MTQDHPKREHYKSYPDDILITEVVSSISKVPKVKDFTLRKEDTSGSPIRMLSFVPSGVLNKEVSL